MLLSWEHGSRFVSRNSAESEHDATTRRARATPCVVCVCRCSRLPADQHGFRGATATSPRCPPSVRVMAKTRERDTPRAYGHQYHTEGGFGGMKRVLLREFHPDCCPTDLPTHRLEDTSNCHACYSCRGHDCREFCSVKMRWPFMYMRNSGCCEVVCPYVVLFSSVVGECCQFVMRVCWMSCTSLLEVLCTCMRQCTDGVSKDSYPCVIRCIPVVLPTYMVYSDLDASRQYRRAQPDCASHM